MNNIVLKTCELNKNMFLIKQDVRVLSKNQFTNIPITQELCEKCVYVGPTTHWLNVLLSRN
jgi:hypothetical protein